jgi:hypothetical protein
MGKPSQVIILVEDRRHQQFVLRYLRRVGLEPHAFRFVPSPAGEGSGEQWVRERFAAEVEAYRRRQAETKLIVVIDADNRSVEERLAQLDHELAEVGAQPVRPREEQIARLVPKRNVETWILCLNWEAVDEETDYKNRGRDWSRLIRSGAETLYAWTRANAQVPASCVASLNLGVLELRRLDFREG